ncbi:MAG: hypothetical protein A2469_01995 [Candidatus Magasanikbacteria bacterium RIFOXYC2_FULL_40_16]|uniref:Uncharacterized protein n=2 Tax=Candidatus Magasanikiibacteriota TaxID=1752731 RepID=A0A1F6NFA3_9BACT|nr:MAG: hypothetical protein A2224_02635 [Candidatus Magasanikbacteria bacterium RIFOXYA2_FULL_40_20]OGH82521.1 MAG: hypothetical protein A2373_03305 [Candidatus Magasanikbacteria bacterium RIFOXYB1_FULL_40_15]OGH87009.1 MAG: hypothetical protein A2301_00060 [Candidatus Magasanikbacteria bacterium RIFOXYB2_FULL_40_13]OGH89584.1 MAG: hypothetical protein A2469_01995 [Candidatus Magasanikbacteria bacterium RIFOXYC2_FULL_40_16]
MEEKNNEIRKEILEQIKTGKVKLRSKYIFLAEKLGLGSSFVLSVLLSILFFNLLLFYLKSADALVYLSFGKRGILAFLESFPYLLIVVFILFVVVSGFIISKTDFSYKKSFSFIALGLIMFVIFSGIMATYTNISEEIDKRIKQNHPIGGMFRPFMNGAIMMKDRGIAGRLVEVDKDNIVLETPHGLEVVNIRDCANCVKDLKEGSFVVAIGERDKAGVFKVYDLKEVGMDNMGMIKDRTMERFGYWECRKTSSSTLCEDMENKKECVRGCLEERLTFEECRERCPE